MTTSRPGLTSTAYIMETLNRSRHKTPDHLIARSSILDYHARQVEKDLGKDESDEISPRTMPSYLEEITNKIDLLKTGGKKDLAARYDSDLQLFRTDIANYTTEKDKYQAEYERAHQKQENLTALYDNPNVDISLQINEQKKEFEKIDREAKRLKTRNETLIAQAMSFITKLTGDTATIPRPASGTTSVTPTAPKT